MGKMRRATVRLVAVATARATVVTVSRSGNGELEW